LVVFLKRPGGQSQFSAHLAAQMVDEGKIRSLQHWILDHLSLDLTLDALASRAAMSVRNFTRVFQGETGTTPADFVEMARVDAARRLLEESETPLQRVALRLRESGYDATGVSEKNRHRAQRLSGTISTVTSLRSSSQSRSRWIAFY
jgi:transcriptional regulator GlxA family with amidase domain